MSGGGGMKLENLLNYTQPTKYIVSDEFSDDSYKTPVLTAGKTFILGYTNDADGIYKASKSPIILFDDFTTETKWVDFDFKVKSSACKILTLKNANSVEDLKYIYYAMMNIRFDVSQHMRYWISKYSKREIAYPEKSKRFYIVRALDSINQLILREKQHLKLLDELTKSRFNELFGDVIDNDRCWNTSKLNEVCDVRDGTHDSPKYVSEGYPFVTSKNISNGELDFSNVQYISKVDYLHFEKRSHVDDGDILMPMIGTVGGAVIVKKDREFSIKNVCLIKFFKTNNVLNTYIKYVLNSDEMNLYFDSLKKGGIQPFIGLNTIRSLMIPIPPKNAQYDFVSFVNQVDKLKFNFFIPSPNGNYSKIPFVFLRKPNKQKTWPTIAFLVETRINDAFFLIKRPYKV